MEEAAEKAKSFETFELCVALLLGLAAIGAGLAGLQAGQWGGKQLEAFAEANALTTKASKSYSEAVASMNSDFSVVGTAKVHILQGVDAESDTDKMRSFKLASYYLTRQLNKEAYDALGLPKDKFDTDEPQADGAADATTTEEEVESELGEILPQDVLLGVLDSELDDDDKYEDVMFDEGTKLFADAETKFAEGQKANDNGDKFDLAGVFYTVALFFAGLGLVFKTSLRWSFLAAGALVFLATSGYLASLPWA